MPYTKGHAKDLYAVQDKLTQEEKAIRKCLEYVRLALQKNAIEGMEVESKIKELADRIAKSEHKNGNYLAESNICDFDSEIKKREPLDFDDAAEINKTELNLDVTHRLYQDEDSESLDSV